jgi:hypothetical protein
VRFIALVVKDYALVNHSVIPVLLAQSLHTQIFAVTDLHQNAPAL